MEFGGELVVVAAERDFADDPQFGVGEVVRRCGRGFDRDARAELRIEIGLAGYGVPDRGDELVRLGPQKS
jgi:hypothetical protein